MDLVRISPTSVRLVLSGVGAPSHSLENDTYRVKMKVAQEVRLRPLCLRRRSFLADDALYGPLWRNVPAGVRRRPRSSDCCATNSSEEVA